MCKFLNLKLNFCFEQESAKKNVSTEESVFKRIRVNVPKDSMDYVANSVSI